jgi:hypothetical protein
MSFVEIEPQSRIKVQSYKREIKQDRIARRRSRTVRM